MQHVACSLHVLEYTYKRERLIGCHSGILAISQHFRLNRLRHGVYPIIQTLHPCRPTFHPLHCILFYTSSLVVYYSHWQRSPSLRHSSRFASPIGVTTRSAHYRPQVVLARVRHLKMSGNHSSLLQTAIQNLQISQQAKDRDRPTRTSSDFGSPQSENLELSASEDEGDEIVNVGQGTRPPTRPGSPGPKKLGLRDTSRLSTGESSSTDPVSLHHGRLGCGYRLTHV